MPPRRVNAFREPLGAISRLLNQRGLFSLCGLAPTRRCQHAGNCADADKEAIGQEPLIVILARQLQTAGLLGRNSHRFRHFIVCLDVIQLSLEERRLRIKFLSHSVRCLRL
jgi:hypothetical protein